MHRSAAAAIATAIAVLATAGCLDGDDGTGSGASSSSSTGRRALTEGPFRLETLASGLESPLYAIVIPDGTGRIAVMEQDGIARIWKDGVVSGVFLDVTDRTDGGGEQGLLGLAFHPDYASNGVAIVSYTDNAGDSVLSRMRRNANGSALDPATEEVLLQVDQPFGNHNGGHVLFGPDGMLYFGLGDGGSANDPAGHGQNKQTLLGSMLRIGVGATGPYTIPPDNPFVAESGTPPETWSYGWRNPWRFHFDPVNGDLWIADVGQNNYEEVNHEPAGEGGRNYGWNVYEGYHQHPAFVIEPPAITRAPGFTFPVAEYTHAEGCSVTGGPVYRGQVLPDLVGSVLYGDYCTGKMWALAGLEAEPRVLFEDSGASISSFGLDADGEVLVLDYSGGRLLRLTR